MFHYSIILVILLFLRMKLTFLSSPLIMLFTELCLISLFYNLFRVGNRLLTVMVGTLRYLSHASDPLGFGV